MTGNVLRLVATDGHRLAMRDLVPDAIAGGDASRIVPSTALAALADRLAGGGGGPHELRLADLPEEAGPFPPYEAVVAPQPRRHRLAATVDALRRRVEAAGSVVILDGFEPPLAAAFDRRYLLAALEAAQGPDAIVETDGALATALIRSASDGSFTALVMPIRLEEPAPA